METTNINGFYNPEMLKLIRESYRRTRPAKDSFLEKICRHNGDSITRIAEIRAKAEAEDYFRLIEA